MTFNMLNLTQCNYKLIDVGVAPTIAGIEVQSPWIGGREQHDHELWYVREGVGHVRENGCNWLTLKPGMLAWLKPGQFYESRQDPDDPMGVTHMLFQIIPSAAEVNIDKEIEQLPLCIESFNSAFCSHNIRRITELIWEDYIVTLRAPDQFPETEKPSVRFWAESVTARTSFFAPTYTLMKAPAIATNHISMVLAHTLFKALILEYTHLSQQGALEEASGISRRHQQVVNDLIYETQADLQNKPTVQEMAAYCGYGIDHFCRIFRKITGSSPQEYFLNLRISRARELLITTELSVKEISFNLGYNSASFFSHQFKAKTSMSPQHFRENHLKNINQNL